MNKRSLVRQILNRKKNYLLATYVSEISRKMGRAYRPYDITSYLDKLQKQHIAKYTLQGKRIVGCILANAYL